MNTLHVSLGHNSSAVLTNGDRVVRGYEQERLDRVKSSSAYPRLAIEAAVKNDFVDSVCVGHWFDHFNLASRAQFCTKIGKYLDIDHLLSVSDRITSLSPDFTHHDSHAQSAHSFARAHAKMNNNVVMVVDGFGNLQECFSFYKEEGDRLVLAHRTYGYHLSLGLMYQYTTEYLGLKPNKDEYKLLGYEAHVRSYLKQDEIGYAMIVVERQAREHVMFMLSNTKRPEATTELIDYESLKTARAKWWENANRWRELFPQVTDDFGVKSCVAFCAQHFIETCITMLAEELMYGNNARLILVGGCFLNVKLNRRLAVHPKVKQVIVNPLAGDQGAALGHSAGVLWDRLTWGERRIGNIQGLPVGMEYCHPGEWMKVATDHLLRNRIVNVVRGSMEFGPRALCNTTTFALPNSRNVSRINALNERDEAMPMAPVMTRLAASKFLEVLEISKQYSSMPYMITTCAFAEHPPEALMGVAHKDPLAPIWTARPQIVDESDIELQTLMNWMPNGILINTSFNYHGEPIVYSEDDAAKTHVMQSLRAKTLGIDEPVTLLVRS